MGYNKLQNVEKFSGSYQIMEDSPAFLMLSAGLAGKRNKRWFLALLTYEGVGELKIPGSFIASVPEITEFPVQDVVEILDISRSTYYRLKDEPRLDPETADKISSLLKLFYQGLEAFEGNKQDFRDWLQSRIPNLGHKKPVDLLKTESGRISVMEAIGRVEYNVYG
jgi:putative toxin-antitoxin system antitoxin component (TIGR02293 family)